MNLSQFQHSFKSLMLDHPDKLRAPDAALAAAFDAGDIPLHERLAVYRNNIVGALSDVIVKTFPLINALVGEKFLCGMAREFVLIAPPTQGCLNSYGAGFDGFIRGFKPAENLPYLADIARLELAGNDAYYVRDDEPLRAEDLACIDPDDLGDLVLQLRASVRLMQSSYPLLDIRALCLNPDAPPPDMEKPCYAMVHRPALEVIYTALTPDEHMALTLLQSGTPLGDAVEAVLDAHPDFNFQAFLQKHLALETFAVLASNKVTE